MKTTLRLVYINKMDPKDRIKYGPDRSKSSSTIGKNSTSAFTKIKKPVRLKLPQINKKVCVIS